MITYQFSQTFQTMDNRYTTNNLGSTVATLNYHFQQTFINDDFQ